MLDLSTIYGVNEEALAKIKKGEHGILILEKRKQRYLPQNISNVRTTPGKTDDNVMKADDENSIKTKEGKELTTKSGKLIKALKTNVTDNVTVTNYEMVTNITNNLKSENVCIQNSDDENTCYQFGK